MGMGTVVVSRRMLGGQLAVGSFLVDVFCLGVKNAGFTLMSELEFETVFGPELAPEEFESISPACARKLVEDAVAYADDLGIQPHPEYKLAKQIFGNIDKNDCEISFVFGKDGKPFYMPGPNETPGDIRRVINKLAARLGPDGFHYGLFESSLMEDID
jgi:hypothetical protein